MVEILGCRNTVEKLFFFVRKFSSQNAKFEAKNAYLNRNRANIKILSTLPTFFTVCQNCVGNLRRPSKNCNFLPCLLF